MRFCTFLARPQPLRSALDSSAPMRLKVRPRRIRSRMAISRLRSSRSSIEAPLPEPARARRLPERHSGAPAAADHVEQLVAVAADARVVSRVGHAAVVTDLVEGAAPVVDLDDED